MRSPKKEVSHLLLRLNYATLLKKIGLNQPQMRVYIKKNT